MDLIRGFERIEDLRFDVPVPGMLTHMAIGDAIAGKKALELLSINYLNCKIKTHSGLDLEDCCPSMIQHLYENIV